MSYQVGVTQAGLPSEQQPYVPPAAAGPLGIAGVSMAGSYIDGISLTHYAVRGRIMQYGSWRYRCTVRLALVSKAVYAAHASIYAPNMTVRMLISGAIGSGSLSKIAACGIISKTSSAIAAIKGIIARQRTQRYLLKGLLQSQHDIVYRVQGVLGAYQRIALQMTGLIRAVCMSKIAIWGRISGNYAKVICATGVIGLGIRSFYKATGMLQQKAIAVYRVAGQMQTAVETRLLQITGKISVPQFIAAVPRRMQDWVTNK